MEFRLFRGGKALLQKEGPKYQYGTGCLSDGVLGAWIGEVCGLRNILDSAKVTSHLKSVYKYNFKERSYQIIQIHRDHHMLWEMKADFFSAPGQKEECFPCLSFTAMKSGQALSTRLLLIL